MAGLSAIVESVDDVDEPLRSLYKTAKIKDKDGRDKEVYALDIENLDAHPAVHALRESRRKDREQLTALNKELKEFKAKVEIIPEGFDPEEWARLLALKEELDKAGGDIDLDKKKQHEAEIQSQKKMHEQQLAKLTKQIADGFKDRDDKIAAKDKVIHQILVDGLTGELAKAGVQPHFLKAAKAVLAPSVKIVEEGGKYQAKVDTDLGEEPLEKFVPQWVQSDEGKHFVEPAKGGGAEGGPKPRTLNMEHNPWTHSSWNMTEQGRIWKTDAARAERMATAAGHKKALGAQRESAKDFAPGSKQFQ